jgi:hypothetical protein
MKNTITFLSLFLLLTSTALFADTVVKKHATSTAEIDSTNTISIYNTGFTLNLQDTDGWSSDFRGSVDGPVDQLNSKDFNLGKFVKELDVKYKVNTEDAIILLSVGKMPTGAKTDINNPSKLGGVMGIRLTIEPTNLPAIQDWLNQNQFKIERIDITRYNDQSANTLDLNDLNQTNMTSFAAYLSKGNNFQTFFIYKTPDSDNQMGVTSKSLGAVYIMSGKLKPQLFAMKHTSDAVFMNLDLLVLSASVELIPNFTSTFTYSKATELMGHADFDTYDVSLSREIVKTKDFTLSTTFGVKVDRGTTEDKIVYLRLEAKY